MSELRQTCFSLFHSCLDEGSINAKKVYWLLDFQHNNWASGVNENGCIEDHVNYNEMRGEFALIEENKVYSLRHVARQHRICYSSNFEDIDHLVNHKYQERSKILQFEKNQTLPSGNQGERQERDIQWKGYTDRMSS